MFHIAPIADIPRRIVSLAESEMATFVLVHGMEAGAGPRLSGRFVAAVMM